MKTTAAGMFRTLAARSVIAALPVAMVSAYASNLFVPTPPRMAAFDYQQVAEIVTTNTTVGLADSSLYFLTDSMLVIDPVEVARHLDAMLALGVENVRVYVPWRYVEVDEGAYDWSSMDVIMNLAADRDMGVLAEINTSPDWVDEQTGASGGAGHPLPADFKDFVLDFADRYGNDVSAYEIWNEPNYASFYGPVDPAAYTELLKAVYPDLKAIDPTATVVAAGLGHGGSTITGDRLNPVDFVAAMYAAGAKGYFDAIAYHPYQETTPFSQSGTPDGYALNQALAMIGLMAGQGDYALGPDGQPLRDENGNPVSKKIWTTEYGLPTSRVTPEYQAQYIQDFLNTWKTLSWAGPAFLYTAVDTVDDDTVEGSYGVYFHDLDPVTGLYVKKPIAEWLQAQLTDPNAPAQTFDPLNPPVNPTGPTASGAPTNPVQAFVALIQAFFQQIVRAVTQTVDAFVRAIVNVVGLFAGPAVKNVVPLSLRSAPAAEAREVNPPEADTAAASATNAKRNAPAPDVTPGTATDDLPGAAIAASKVEVQPLAATPDDEERAVTVVVDTGPTSTGSGTESTYSRSVRGGIPNEADDVVATSEPRSVSGDEGSGADNRRDDNRRHDNRRHDNGDEGTEPRSATNTRPEPGAEHDASGSGAGSGRANDAGGAAKDGGSQSGASEGDPSAP